MASNWPAIWESERTHASLAGDVEGFVAPSKSGGQELALETIVAATVIEQTRGVTSAIEDDLLVLVEFGTVFAGDTAGPQRLIHNVASLVAGPVVPVPLVNIGHGQQSLGSSLGVVQFGMRQP